MSEQAPETEAPPVEPTPLETVARLAAEGVLRALPPRPDHEDRIAAVEAQAKQILELLTAAAGPEGNAAKLAERLALVEDTVARLAAAGPQPHPEQQKLIDELRLKVAKIERKP